LNRPDRKNALTLQVYAALADALLQADQDKQVRALASFSKPVVAAVNGPAVGIGATMLLHCDFVIVASDAHIVFPFVKLGLCPEFGSTFLLVSRLGYQRAAELLLLGEPSDGPRAVQLGLANKTLPSAEVLPHAHRVAVRLAALPTEAVQVSKRLMREALAQHCEQQIEKETLEFSRLLGSIRIFVGKAVEQLLSPGLGESVAEHDGKLIHRGFPIEGCPHRFIQHVA
jgi:enoyl-CoA hydratase/carnithine racemase